VHKLYSPETELDLAFIKSLFESENIDYFVHNDHYGSLNIGPKIDLFNAKTIYVNENDAEKAKELIDIYLEDQNKEENQTEPNTFSLITKIRIIIEAIIFSWFIPQGRRWKKNKEK
jgi:hypothetical protein